MCSTDFQICGAAGFQPAGRKEKPLQRLDFAGRWLDFMPMRASEATAEIFVTAFKSLKRRQREAVLERMLADAELSEDLADTVALEARRRAPRHSFRQTLVLRRRKGPSNRRRCHWPSS